MFSALFVVRNNSVATALLGAWWYGRQTMTEPGTIYGVLYVSTAAVLPVGSANKNDRMPLLLLLLLLPVIAEQEAVYRGSRIHISVTHKVYNGIGSMCTITNPGSAARTAEKLRGDDRVHR